MKSADTQFRDRNFARLLSPLANPRAIILIVAVLHLIATYVWIQKWYAEFGEGITSVYPDWRFKIPMLLIMASTFLLIGSRWTSFLALVISVWVLYAVGYVGIRSMAVAHDTSLFTPITLQRWFTQVWAGQPQYFLELALALVIAGYAGVNCC